MRFFYAFGGLCHLRKHGSNRRRLAGKLRYFCNSSVIWGAGARWVLRYCGGERSRPEVLRVRATVIESRRSLSKPDRGIIKTLAEAENQDGRTVMRCTAINFLRVRPSS